VLQAPADHVLDGVTHLIPRSVECLGGFLPGELPCPASQKQHIGFGQLVFTLAPRNLLDHHATNPALDAPHAIQQENRKTPERNELKAPLGKMIVTRCRLVAT
jgi:hypothetical protein